MQFQIPKMRVDVKVHLHGALELRGSIFVSESVLSFTGKPRLEDFLNTGEQFFPFIGENQVTSLLNKNQLIMLESSEEDRSFLIEQLMLKPRAVLVCLSNGHQVQGSIYSSLPQESLRVSDFFNQHLSFLPIYKQGTKLIVNTNEILYIND